METKQRISKSDIVKSVIQIVDRCNLCNRPVNNPCPKCKFTHHCKEYCQSKDELKWFVCALMGPRWYNVFHKSECDLLKKITESVNYKRGILCRQKTQDSVFKYSDEFEKLLKQTQPATVTIVHLDMLKKDSPIEYKTKKLCDFFSANTKKQFPEGRLLYCVSAMLETNDIGDKPMGVMFNIEKSEKPFVLMMLEYIPDQTSKKKKPKKKAKKVKKESKEPPKKIVYIPAVCFACHKESSRRCPKCDWATLCSVGCEMKYWHIHKDICQDEKRDWKYSMAEELMKVFMTICASSDLMGQIITTTEGHSKDMLIHVDCEKLTTNLKTRKMGVDITASLVPESCTYYDRNKSIPINLFNKEYSITVIFPRDKSMLIQHVEFS